MILPCYNKKALFLALLLAASNKSAECFVVAPGRSSLTNAPSVMTTTRSTARWATNIVPLSSNDEVQRLQTMAAQLRVEAALLEQEQTTKLQQVATKLFEQFDADKNGSIDASELQTGLQQLLFKNKKDTNEVVTREQTEQLLQTFDTNNDGVLSKDEFILTNANAFRSRLDSIQRQERNQARQQAKLEREQAELQQAQMELVNDQEPSSVDKIVSVLPYLFPLLDGLQFAQFLVQGHESNPLAQGAFLAYALYRSIPFSGLLAFFGLSFLSDMPKVNRLVRFNAQQAVYLDIFLFAPAIFSSLGGALLNTAGVSLPANLAELGADGLFVALIATIAYASASSLLGQTPNLLPFVSKRVEDRMISPEMFDKDGRFAPFDKEGNLKTSLSNKKAPQDDNDDKKN